MKKIKGVSISVSVSFSWNKKERTEFVDLLKIIGGRTKVLENMRDYDLLPAIAYAFDHLDNPSFIITGSEVRVFKFLRVNDPRSPLYGRAISEIQLKPFDKETAISFLKKGFEEFGIDLSYMKSSS